MKERTCLSYACGCPASSRGLCPACYIAAGRRIKRGLCTWSQLEELGQSSPMESPKKSRSKTLCNS